MEMKGTLASVATALASRVLPVPGGPYNRAPCEWNGIETTGLEWNGATDPGDLGSQLRVLDWIP